MSAIITIIGAGNMGASLLGGLIANGFSPNSIWITDPDQDKLAQLATTFHIHTTTSNEEAVQHANVVILAVKPQIMPIVLAPLSPLIQQHKPLIISIAAGIRENKLATMLGSEIAIIRCMPNTPALIRCGASALHANSYVTQQQREFAQTILSAVGMVVWLEDESAMDAVTALSGSGPAYFFLVIEAMQQAGQQLGLSPETARLLTLQTALGAATMAMQSDEPASVLRQRVTSPGGTTEAAINVLETQHLRDIFQAALTAAKHRSEELARS